MRKTTLILAAALASAVLTAQTVSTSSVRFANCQTEYATENYYFGEKEFPVTIHGKVYENTELSVFDTISDRGCDLLIDVNVVRITGVLYAHAFSVKASGAGSKVYFSKGNLQYIAASNQWQFASKQHIAMANSGNNLTRATTATSALDIYAFGCSGWDGSTYMPTSKTAYTQKAPHQKNQYDLAWYNSISNGGGEKVWYTLTQAEWKYLLNERTNYSDLRMKATIAGFRGLIILPDDWEDIAEISLTRTVENFTTNTLSSYQWSLLEKRGAIFLPSTGMFAPGWIGTSSNDGFYLTADPSVMVQFRNAASPNLGVTDASGWLGAVRPVRAAN